MHTIGKVFLGLIVVFLVPAAVLLTARLINTRNHWMEQISTEQESVKTQASEIAEKKATLDEQEATLARQRTSWDTLFVAEESGVDRQGLLTVGVGPRQGFGVVPEGAPAPVIHAFMPRPDGGSIYAGPFQIAAAQGNQAQLKPMFTVLPGEAPNWTRGTWRLWQMIPSQAPRRVIDLTSEIVKAREALASRQQTLQQQQEAVSQAKAALRTRQQELMGNPDAPAGEADPEAAAGLVATLQDAEAARNAESAKLDRLRRDVDQAYQRLTAMVGQNKNLAGELTGRAPSGQGPTLDVSDAR